MCPADGYPWRMNQTPNPPAKTTAVPAALGWRLIALTYDCLPMIPILMITSAVFLWMNGGRTVERDPLIASLEFATIWLLVGAYFVASWRRGGQTVGMRPWRLKVVAADGKLASVRALWLRYAVAWLTPVVGLLWTLIDAERRGLHDIASGTLFVRLQASTSA
jgi:uncharacterized RDD family membrane protein YckC